MSREETVILAGLGNVGVLLAMMVVRLPWVKRLVLVDPDVVEEKNVAAQAYDLDDVGRPKVDAVRRKLIRVSPSIGILVRRGGAEDLPWGLCRHHVVLAVDGNAVRRLMARRVWAMGGSLVDAAVNGPAGLVRVTEIGAGPEAGCWECAWSPEQSAFPPARHSCASNPPTNAPLAFGGLAASVAAMAILKIGRRGTSSDSTELTSTGSEMFRSVIPRSPECGFHHERIDFESVPGFDFGQSLRALFDLVGEEILRLPGFLWSRKCRCASCAREIRHLRVARGAEPGACASCGGELVRLGFYEGGSLGRESLSAAELSLSLSEVGLMPDDLLMPGDSRRGVLLGAPPCHPATTEQVNTSQT